MVFSKIKKFKEEKGDLIAILPIDFLEGLGWKKQGQIEYKIKDKNTIKATQTKKQKPNTKPLITLEDKGQIKIIFPITLGYALDFTDKDLEFTTDKNELIIKQKKIHTK